MPEKRRRDQKVSYRKTSPLDPLQALTLQHDRPSRARILPLFHTRIVECEAGSSN
jgi:hypothetical protein